jgi:hypothetical protein
MSPPPAYMLGTVQLYSTTSPVQFLHYTPELEFLKSLWGLGTKEE